VLTISGDLQAMPRTPLLMGTDLRRRVFKGVISLPGLEMRDCSKL